MRKTYNFMENPEMENPEKARQLHSTHFECQDPIHMFRKRERMLDIRKPNPLCYPR